MTSRAALGTILRTGDCENDDEVSGDNAESKSRAGNESEICTMIWDDNGDINGIHDDDDDDRNPDNEGQPDDARTHDGAAGLENCRGRERGLHGCVTGSWDSAGIAGDGETSLGSWKRLQQRR